MRGSGKLWLTAGLMAVFASPNIAFRASTITGTVTFEGKAPAPKPLAMDADPTCAKKHTKPVMAERLVLGSGNTIGNVLVYVSKGLPAGKTFPPPKNPVTLDQNGCVYVPHVQGIMVGQAYRILNSDGVLHNVHALPKINPAFNQPMPPSMKETTKTFAKAEPIFQIKCDVHPWMQAWIGVFTHPFFSTTGADGKFTISGLDPGTYEITAWHEVPQMTAQTATITVGANETKTQNFKFISPLK